MTPPRLAAVAATAAILGLAIFHHYSVAQQAAKPAMAMPMPTDAKPLPSPAASDQTTIEGRDVKVTYNAPSMRGRKIMGDLVPYGKVWRTGANAATTFYTEDSLMIGDLAVKAGTYTLYTLPGAPGTPWKLIINKQTGQWGTVYDEKQDLGRVEMKSMPLATPQEKMTLSFENKKKSEAELHVRWETTDVWVKLEPMPTQMMFIPKKKNVTASATPPPTP